MSQNERAQVDTQAFVARLFEAGVLNIDGAHGFKLTSGQTAPLYLDHRLLFGLPELRHQALTLWADQLADSLKPRQNSDLVVVGTATAGIAPAFGLAERLGTPFAYVRSAAKEHGLRRCVEGALRPGAAVVVVDDMVSTGTSVLVAADRLREEGHPVLLVTSFTARQPGESVIRSRGYSFFSVFQLGDLLALARDAGLMSPRDWKSCEDWLESLRSH
jgi:orotate phosphoribosyltransferase